MENGGEYRIVIDFRKDAARDASGGAAVRTEQSQPAEIIERADSRDPKDMAKSKSNPTQALIRQMAGKAGQAALNNYGNLTGDYIGQQNYQTMISESTRFAGAISLGWSGIALYALDKAISGYEYLAELKRSERDAAFRQKRVLIGTEHA